MKASRQRAFTLIEVLVSFSLLGLLFTFVFAVYRVGAAAWLKGDANAELLGRVQALSSKIGREAERSSSSSLSIALSDIDPNLKGCAFMSAVDANGVFQYDPGTTAPRWGFADVYYFDISGQRVYAARQALVGADRIAVSKDYGERFLLEPYPSTRNPLPDRFTSGQPIANGIKNIDFRALDRVIVNTGGSTAATTQELGQLEITIAVEKKAYGTDVPVSLTSKSYYLFRN